MLAKTPAAVEEVFAPKIHGTQVLDALFPDGRLDWMAVFASSSTVTAPAGQVDYVAANDYLNAFAQARAGGRTRVVALNWGIWAGVGMAAEALADRMGTRPEAPRLPAPGPVLTAVTHDRAGRRLYEATVSTTDWVLDQHRMKGGRAVFPGTGYLELLAEAARAEGMAAFDLCDLTFFRAMEVAEGEARALRVRLTASDEGSAPKSSRTRCIRVGRAGSPMRPRGCCHSAWRPAPWTQPQSPPVCPRPKPATGWPARKRCIWISPRWRVIRSRAMGDGEGLAQLALPAAHAAEAGNGRCTRP